MSGCPRCSASKIENEQEQIININFGVFASLLLSFCCLCAAQFISINFEIFIRK